MYALHTASLPNYDTKEEQYNWYSGPSHFQVGYPKCYRWYFMIKLIKFLNTHNYTKMLLVTAGEECRQNIHKNLIYLWTLSGQIMDSPSSFCECVTYGKC